MHPGDISTDELLAAAARGEETPWPEAYNDGDADAVFDAAAYHGVIGLLVDHGQAIGGWPASLEQGLIDHARAQAMWELRHREVIASLLTALHEEGVPSLLMKGTALAYDLYANPAARSRGDTDLLIAEADLDRARQVLRDLDFVPSPPEAFTFQEAWSIEPDGGGRHEVDLHWQVLNAPSLNHLLTVEECMNGARPLPRLSPHARTMDRVHLLLHTCIHRAVHNNAPYFTGSREYYGPGRLIWSNDVHLLAESLTPQDWAEFCSMAEAKAVAGPCLSGLRLAQSDIHAAIPRGVIPHLDKAARGEPGFAYLIPSRKLYRAFQDIRAVPGALPKMRYALGRILPPEAFMRGKYPQMASSPLPLLYGRRLLDLVRRAPRAS